MDSITTAYNHLVSSDELKSTQHHCLVKDLNIDSLLNWICRIKSIEFNSIPIAWFEHKSTVQITMTKKCNGVSISIE